MDEMVRLMYLCNLKCEGVNLTLEELQRMGKLSGYETVPAMPVSDSIMKPHCFRMRVKKCSPLYKYHGVDSVSVSIPMDAMGNRSSDGICGLKLPETIEILLFKGDRPYYDYPGISDVKRFEEPQDLVDALNKLARLRAAKKAAKAERVARAQRPEQVAKKTALVSRIENGRRPRAVMDAEGKEAVMQRMKREVLGEVDTDGEDK